MRQYNEEEEKIIHRFLKSITCDICHTTYEAENDRMEMQEVIQIRHSCGFGSVFGDGDAILCDVCQHCLKEKFGQYIQIIPEGEEY